MACSSGMSGGAALFGTCLIWRMPYSAWGMSQDGYSCGASLLLPVRCAAAKFYTVAMPAAKTLGLIAICTRELLGNADSSRFLQDHQEKRLDSLPFTQEGS